MGDSAACHGFVSPLLWLHVSTFQTQKPLPPEMEKTLKTNKVALLESHQT